MIASGYLVVVGIGSCGRILIRFIAALFSFVPDMYFYYNHSSSDFVNFGVFCVCESHSL